MKKIAFIFGGLFFCLLIFCSHLFVLKDKDLTYDPAWRSFRGDLRNSGYVQKYTSTPEKLLWKLELNGKIKSTPVVAGDVIFVSGMDKKLYFVDANSGKRLGDLSLKKTYPSFLSLQNSFLYISGEGEKGTLFCYDLKKGRFEWQKELGSSRSSPVVIGDRIFLGTETGKLYALNKFRVEPIWQFKKGGKKLSSPAYSEGLLFLGLNDGWFYALVEKTGWIRWKFKIREGIVSSPAIQNGQVLFGSLEGMVYSLNKNDGELIWNFETSGPIYSSPAVTESSVFIGSNDGFLYKIDLTSGQLGWKFDASSPIHSSPLVVGDNVFFGSLDGRFYLVDRWSGKLKWKFQTSGMITASPVFYKDKIYLCSEDGFLYCFGP
ncbi:MAG: PQQ-binding-like beta-propeller repeat protein [Candidatus Zixiibacteriota bacterium]